MAWRGKDSRLYWFEASRLKTAMPRHNACNTTGIAGTATVITLSVSSLFILERAGVPAEHSGHYAPPIDTPKTPVAVANIAREPGATHANRPRLEKGYATRMKLIALNIAYR